jgi:hypothetical protein
MKIKENQTVRLMFQGGTATGRVMKTWAKKKDIVGIRITGFDYGRIDPPYHLVKRTDILK